MSGILLDRVDREILYSLQLDARNTTTREIADRVGVTPSTVSNRIDQLESDGIITDYQATIDYERAGYPMHVLVICTAPILERETVARAALEIPGVVNVREMMDGEDNVRVEAVGESNEDITRVVTALAQLADGEVTVSEEHLIRTEFDRPLDWLDDTAE